MVKKRSRFKRYIAAALIAGVMLCAEGITLGSGSLQEYEIFTVSALAASKKEPELKATSKTIYTTTSSYTIKFNNTTDAATYKFTSSDKSVATVSKKGVVKPVGIGKATITAKVTQGGKTYSLKVKITVKEPYLKFIGTPKSELKPGESQTLEVKAYGFTLGTVKWSSENKDWLSVSSKGKVTAKAAGEGRSVTITAKDKTTGYSCSTEISIPYGEAVRVGKYLLKGEGIDPDVAAFLTENYQDKQNSKLSDGKGSLVVPLKSKNAVDKYVREMSATYNSFHLCVEKAEYLRSPADYIKNVVPSCSELTFDWVILHENTMYLWVSVNKICENYYDSDSRICNAVITGVHYNDLSEEEMTAAQTAKWFIDLAMAAYDNDYDRVKFFHDELVTGNRYDTTYSRYKLVNALGERVCVCDGYSKAFQLLCKGVGIECIYVSGTTEGGSDSGHSWNKVKLDGEWYNIDVTWDDPLPDGGPDPNDISYAYFLISDKDISVNHTPEKEYVEASSDKYCLIKRQIEEKYGDIKKVKSDSAVKKSVNEQLDARETEIRFIDTREENYDSWDSYYIAYELLKESTVVKKFSISATTIMGVANQFYGVQVVAKVTY